MKPEHEDPRVPQGRQAPLGPAGANAHKSRGGLARLWHALGYSRQGLAAAFRHEAAFRQELLVGLPLIALAWWLAPDAPRALALSLSIVFVFVVELLNSALEAVADAVTTDEHALIKRAKDIGSAAVLLSLLAAGATWVVVLAS